MATIAEKSRTKEIIDRLQGIMENASPVPLASGKVMIYKDEVQSLLAELASQMEIELKTYHEVNDRKGKIINEAKKEAEKIIYQAEHTASRMRVNKRSTNVPPVDFSMLTQEELDALDNANEIYGASLIYTDEMLTEVNNLISDVYHNIRSDYEIILQTLEEKMNTIAANRAELMDGLQEMDAQERSQQILEIGQLLSDELFNARMKSHMNPDEYDDGSVQLSLDLQEEQEEKTRQAEAKAQQAEAALAEMKAERDALIEKVSKMQQETKLAEEASNAANIAEEQKESAEQPSEDEEEYEIVYVTEDELEEGEEYEIEYVDEDELEEGEEYEVEYVEEDEPEEGEEHEAEYVDEDESGKEKEDTAGIPIIPHFRKSEKIARVPSERIAKMASAITTDKKYSGLISRAVAEREKAEEASAVTIEKTEPVKSEKTTDVGKEPAKTEKTTDARAELKEEKAKKTSSEEKQTKDEDIKTDENGKEYVQATMQFDEDFEIMEF